MGLTLLNQENTTASKIEILNTPERIAAAVAEHPAFLGVDLYAEGLVVLDVNDIFCYDQETPDPDGLQPRAEGTPQDAVERYYIQATEGHPETGIKGIREPITVSTRLVSEVHALSFTGRKGHTRLATARKAGYKFIIGKIDDDSGSMNLSDQIDDLMTDNTHADNGVASTPHTIKLSLKKTLHDPSYMREERQKIATAELALKKAEGLNKKERKEIKSLIRKQKAVVLGSLQRKAYRWGIGNLDSAKRAAKKAYDSYMSEEVHKIASLDKDSRADWLTIAIEHEAKEGNVEEAIFQRFLLKVGEGGFFPKLAGDINAKVRKYRMDNKGKSPKKLYCIMASHGAPNTEAFFKSRVDAEDFLQRENKFVWSHGLPAGEEVEVIVKYLPQIKEGKYREDFTMTYENLKDVDYIRKCYQELKSK